MRRESHGVFDEVPQSRGLCGTPLVDAFTNYATFKQKQRRIPKVRGTALGAA
jgi:hypothetical protein